MMKAVGQVVLEGVNLQGVPLKLREKSGVSVGITELEGQEKQFLGPSQHAQVHFISR